MTTVTTTGADISTLLDFSRIQLDQRQANMDQMQAKAMTSVDAVLAALNSHSFTVSSDSLNSLTFTFDQPGLKGNLVLTGTITGSGMSVRSATFTSTDPANDLQWSLKGSLDYNASTGAVTGQIREASVSTLDGLTSLIVSGPRSFDADNDLSGQIKLIKYTEAGITTEIKGRLSVDDNDHISGSVDSLAIWDSSHPQNKISWTGKFDYAQLETLSAPLGQVKDIFSNPSMAPLFSHHDVFDIQSKDTLSESGASLQTVWYAWAGNDLMKGGDGRETFYGGTGNDRLYGGKGDDVLAGEQGNDHLFGGDGIDQLLGGDGNDRLEGGAQADIMNGGAGNDVYQDTDGDNTIEDSGGNNVITTGSGNDLITTAAGQDKIRAGDGNNTIHAGAGHDVIFTGSGNDVIYGEAGNDLIRAGAGNDIISSGSGFDQIFGGTGADTFVISALQDRGFAKIQDFKAGEGDMLLFDPVVFNQLNAATLADQFVASATGVASNTDQHLIFDTRNGKLYYDEDGSGAAAAHHIATLVGVHELSAASLGVLI